MKTVKIIDNQLFVTRKKKSIVAIEDIILLTSESNYTWLHMQEGRPILAPITLRLFDIALSQKGFMRVNRGCMVNQIHIERTLIHDSMIYLTNGYSASISRRQKALYEMKLKPNGAISS